MLEDKAEHGEKIHVDLQRSHGKQVPREHRKDQGDKLTVNQADHWKQVQWVHLHD